MTSKVGPRATEHKLRSGLVSVLALGVLLLSAVGSRGVLFAANSPERKSFTPEETARIAAQVLPKNGYTLPIKWGNLGPTLVQLGVIDLEKFKKLYGSAGLPDYFRYLEKPSEDFISINRENQQFLVTVFWALGLANKSSVLEKMRETNKFMNFASIGGWTLGAKPTTELYSKFEIIPLTSEQQELVSNLAQSIYRPCCDNPTALPDCNHGMGVLGLIELMVAQGFNREEVLKASLQFNAFWFPQQYTQTAFLFKLRGVDWDAVDPGEVLGSQYSSLTGWTQNVANEVKKLAPPVLAQEGSSCQISAPPSASSGTVPTVKTSQEAAPVHGLVLDRNDPSINYVATYMGLVRAPRNAAPEFVGRIRFNLVGITANPKKAGVLYASGHPDHATYQRDGIRNLGLLLSEDEGQTWRSVAAAGKAAFHALTYSPQNGGELYGWNVAGQPGLYRISLGTWAVKRLPAKGLSGVLSLSTSPNAVGPLLAGTRTGLMVSRNQGASWAPVAGIPRDTQVTAVTYHPTNGRLAYAYVAKPKFGLMRSEDGGVTWKPTGYVAAPGTNVIALAVNPKDNVVSVATQFYIMGIPAPVRMPKKAESFPSGGVPTIKEKKNLQKN